MTNKKYKRPITDTEKHEQSQSDQMRGETSLGGSMGYEQKEGDDPSEIDQAKDEEGLYPKADEEHPEEVGIAKEEEKKERRNQRGY